MSIYFVDNYTVPVIDQPLTHARILHKGNRAEMKTTVASDTAADSFAVAVLGNAMTSERWKPFSNVVVDPSDYSKSGWTITGLTLAGDNQTLAETAVNSEHKISTAVTYTAVEWVASAKVDRKIAPEVQLLATDGGNNSVFFDLRNKTVGTASGATGTITDLGNGQLLLKMYWTALAATGTLELKLSDGSEAVSYLGVVTNTIKAIEMVAHESLATVDFTPWNAAEALDIFALAAHNLADSGGRVRLQHGAAHTEILIMEPTDNEPFIGIYEPLAATEWRIVIDRAVLPEIGVVRQGVALQITRPIYGGHEPLALSRNTVMRSNRSETGEWMGRTKLRTSRGTSFSWSNINKDWVRTYWVPFQVAAEDEPFFLAWRPVDFPEVGYCSTPSIDTPSNSGTRGLMTIGFKVTGFLNV